jgi:hypothetical protein
MKKIQKKICLFRIKKCTRCGIEKEESEVNFYKTAYNRAAYQSECKECYKKRARKKSGYHWEKNFIGW